MVRVAMTSMVFLNLTRFSLQLPNIAFTTFKSRTLGLRAHRVKISYDSHYEDRGQCLPQLNATGVGPLSPSLNQYPVLSTLSSPSSETGSFSGGNGKRSVYLYYILGSSSSRHLQWVLCIHLAGASRGCSMNPVL